MFTYGVSGAPRDDIPEISLVNFVGHSFFDVLSYPYIFFSGSYFAIFVFL